jgi:ubiquinone/menaquinone biosynthesis C-methylase UbiE
MLEKIFRFGDYYRDQFIACVAHSIEPGAKVLDAGAGTCKYRHLFMHCDYKTQDFTQYHGADMKYGTIDYIGDITSIPVENESFDYVLCTEVFEHIPQPDLALKEFARILKPGGGGNHYRAIRLWNPHVSIPFLWRLYFVLVPTLFCRSWA